MSQTRLVSWNKHMSLKVVLAVFAMIATTSSSFVFAKDIKDPVIAVTARPLALVVQDLCQSLCQVHAVIPAQGSEHHVQLSPKDVKDAKRASALISVGLGFDDHLVRAIVPDTKRQLFLGEKLEPLTYQTSVVSAHGQHLHTMKAGTLDPHVWFDPERMRLAARVIHGFLKNEIPSSDAKLAENLDKFERSLVALMTAIKERRSKWPEHRFMLLHDELRYLALRFNINAEGVMAAADGTELTPHLLAKVIRNQSGRKVTAVITDSPSGIGKTLAKELKSEAVIVETRVITLNQGYVAWITRIVDQLQNAVLEKKQ